MRILMWIGSGKPAGHSTSEALARWLGGALQGQIAGATFDLLPARTTLKDGAPTERLLRAVDDCDLLVLASPVYVDSLPYPVIHGLEAIAAHRTRAPDHPVRRLPFAALINCGFPEPSHCDIALAQCNLFARQAELTWLGGLALGAGEAFHGQPLDAVGPMAAPVTQALTEMAQALAAGEPVPASAQRYLARPIIPPFLYRWMGAWGWWRQARGFGAVDRLDATPFTEIDEPR